MSLLRITQTAINTDRYQVEIAFEPDRGARRTATASFEFKLTAQDHEDIRWYLEDYLQYPQEPAPTIAARIEKRMTEIGVELFTALFEPSDDSSGDARDLWATLRTELNETRVEIITSVQEATSIPWELIRDPKTDTPLALRARAFVRAQPQAVQEPYVPESDAERIRILLVICRPKRDDDVPFRSVATRLIKGLSDNARARFQLDVLRPPTFEQLGSVLRAAKADGQPYHVVHFDGHGVFLDMERLFKQWEEHTEEEMLRLLAEILDIDDDRFSPTVVYPKTPEEGRHGYLAFENPESGYNIRLVDAQELSGVLLEGGVPLLVLNACRSAYAEAPTEPVAAGTESESPVTTPSAPDAQDVHAQIRALGSLAQEVMDAGVTGVVAMRYIVYVVTAAQFVAELYATLTQGRSLGEAVTLGRKKLADDPLREIAFEPHPLQDWPVPVVYEATPIALFPKRDEAETLTVTVADERATAERGELDPKLPKRPDVGFFGRDETLLALDRAFDRHHVVLLHAYAGSGKTATAAEFARWYALTGGVRGPVLFTSFEQHTPLVRVLDQIGQVFGQAMEQAGVHWLAIDEEERRRVALQVLKQIPVLWIWDNVEPVAGFPTGTESAWSKEEQQALVDFLRDAQETHARFLLTSRRDEQAWLGDLPQRVAIPPMPFQERVQLARGLAERHDRRLTDVDDWRPLLAFTRGNPLTITVLVGQALRDGLKTKDEIEAFVARLRAGEAAFDDEASEGRSKSLGASLSYGFEHAFSEQDRKRLALLHFFQGFVDVDALKAMGNPEAEWCLPELRALTREEGIVLLERAAEVGLLTAHGGGYYTIHPALPWFFKELHDQHYSHRESSGDEEQLRATRAFVQATASLGSYYHAQYQDGDRRAIYPLGIEEANLLHARDLARRYEWWDPVIGTMQGLSSLYGQTGRRTEWARLVHEIIPDFVDAASNGPLPGREERWGIITEYRVRLASQAREWGEAERLQRIRVDWQRKRSAAALATAAESLDVAQRNDIRSLSVSLSMLANILRERGDPDCVAAYQEDHELSLRIGDRPGASVTAFNAGHAYVRIPDLRDLGQAEKWYRRSLELRAEHDRLGRGRCLGQLGAVALERFDEARQARKPEEEMRRHLGDALRFYGQALERLPSNAVDDLAVTHHQVGNIYLWAGDLEAALRHYRESIRYGETQGDLFGAAQTRSNVAVVLANAKRFQDAREYAHAALRSFETFGEGAEEETRRTRELIARIEQAIQAQGG